MDLEDLLSPEMVAKYKAEDALARKRIQGGVPNIDNGWNSDLENQLKFGQSGFGDTFTTNPNFGRGAFRNNRGFQGARCGRNDLSRTQKNPNWKRNPPYIQPVLNEEFQVYSNQSFIKDFQCPGNWVTKICERREDVECFEAEVQSLYEAMKATEEEVKKKELFRKTIEAMINKYDQELQLQWSAQVFQTGSSISGLAARGSDVDLCIFIPNAGRGSRYCERVNSFRILQIVRHLLLLQKEKGKTDEFPFELEQITLRDAMIPIIKIFTECELECDLSVCCNPFLSGVHNSLLIKGYTEFDPRFAPLAMFVKAWASKTKLKQPIRPKAKFNSYAITMLLIHFLQCGVDPPVLPNLRQKCGPGFYATTQNDFPVKLDVRKMPKPTLRPDTIPNFMSLPELFIRFCLYYSNFDYSHWYPSLKESKVGLRKYKPEMKRASCYIEDPIDEHNPGRTLYDLQGARFIFRNTANAFRHAIYHPDHFPTVQQILINQMLANGRYLLIAKTKIKKPQQPKFIVIRGEVETPPLPENLPFPTVSVEELRSEVAERPHGSAELPEQEEETVPPGVVIPKDYEFDDEPCTDDEDGNEEEDEETTEES